MKTLADVVAEHVESVLHNVHTAASIMGSRGFPDPHDRAIYLAAAQDVLTATSLALGLPADFGPALPTPALRLPQPYTLEHTLRGKLTAREMEVARLICDGLSTREIAERLILEPTTIKKHRSHIMKALGTSDRATLTAKRAEWEVAE